jgi:hypothetical protein
LRKAEATIFGGIAGHAFLQSAVYLRPWSDSDTGHRSRGRRAVSRFTDVDLGKGVIMANDAEFHCQSRRRIRHRADSS